MTDSQDWWPADYGHYGGFSSECRGTPPLPTVFRTAVVVEARVSSDSLP